MQISSRSRWQIRLQNALFVVLFLGVIGLLAWLSQQHYREIDLSAGARNSLTEQSRQLLQALEGPVQFTAFVQDDPSLHQAITKRIGMYQRVKPDISLHLVNPDLNPDAALAAGITRQGQMLISWGERQQRVESLAEQEIGQALQRLLRAEDRWLVFIEGFGERSLQDSGSRGLSQLQGLLERSGFMVSGQHLIRTPTLPELTSALVLAGPLNPIPEGVQTRLREAVAAGRSLLWLAEPNTQTGLDDLAADLGIAFIDGVVVDANLELRALMGIEHPAVIPVVDYGGHPLTRELNVHTLFPVAVAIDLDLESAWDARPFLITLPRTWAETGPLEGELTLDENAGDRPGPLVLGVSLSREHPEVGEQRVVVIGDSDFIGNHYLGYGGNLDLAMNVFNWLTQDDSLLAINPRSAPDTRLDIGERMLITLGVIFLIVLPFTLLAIGIAIWIARRRS